MPGATNSTLLVNAQNQTVVALNELVTAVNNIPTIDLSGIETKLDTIAARLDTIASRIDSIPAVDLSGIETKLDTIASRIDSIPAVDLSGIEDRLATIADNLDAEAGLTKIGLATIMEQMAQYVESIADNLDVSLTDEIPFIGELIEKFSFGTLPSISIAQIAGLTLLQIFQTRDNLDISATDLFGSLGDLFELLGIDIPVIPESAGLATIHSILTITLIAHLVEALGNDVAKQMALNSIAARLSPDNSKNLYDKDCCSGSGGTGPGDDPVDNPLPIDTWRCKASNFIIESLIDSLVAIGQIGFNYRKIIRQVGYNGYNGYDPTLYTTANMYSVFSTIDTVLPNEIRSKMTTQNRENFKTLLAELVAFEAVENVAYIPFLCYFDNTYNAIQSGAGSLVDYFTENKSDIICTLFNTASVQNLGTELATIINNGALYLTNSDWGNDGIIDMTSKIDVIKSTIQLLLPQGLLNTVFTENDPLVPIVYVGTVNCETCGGSGGGGLVELGTYCSVVNGRLISGDMNSTFIVESTQTNFLCDPNTPIQAILLNRTSSNFCVHFEFELLDMGEQDHLSNAAVICNGAPVNIDPWNMASIDAISVHITGKWSTVSPFRLRVTVSQV